MTNRLVGTWPGSLLGAGIGLVAAYLLGFLFPAFQSAPGLAAMAVVGAGTPWLSPGVSRWPRGVVSLVVLALAVGVALFLIPPTYMGW